MEETWNGERPRESMWMSLAEKHSNGYMEHDEATSCSKARSPMEWYIHEPTHKTFDPKFGLSTRNARTKMEQKLRASQLITSPTWTKPIGKHQSLTLLMILNDTGRCPPGSDLSWLPFVPPGFALRYDTTSTLLAPFLPSFAPERVKLQTPFWDFWIYA